MNKRILYLPTTHSQEMQPLLTLVLCFVMCVTCVSSCSRQAPSSDAMVAFQCVLSVMDNMWLLSSAEVASRTSETKLLGNGWAAHPATSHQQ